MSRSTSAALTMTFAVVAAIVMALPGHARDETRCEGRDATIVDPMLINPQYLQFRGS